MSERLRFSPLLCMDAIRHHHINVNPPDQAESLGNGRGRGGGEGPSGYSEQKWINQKTLITRFPILSLLSSLVTNRALPYGVELRGQAAF